MHEFSIVEGVVAGVSARLRQEGICRAQAIYFRRNSTFSEDTLRMAFASCAAGTPLEGAEVVVETRSITFRCPCGHAQPIAADDLQGHMAVCPACGAVQEIDEAHDLVVTRVVVQEPPPLSARAM
jgi:Zn finger protein HypA/HybF involved in hydrogenase expression